MANLRDVRLRMKAIRQTLQVTKAMNLISTSKLRKGRRVLEDTRPFFQRIQKSMFDIISGAQNLRSNYFRGEGSESYHTAIVIVTSDKGLAGGYNANVFRTVEDLCKKVQNPVLVPIGAVGYRYFVHTPHLILENFTFRSRLPDLDDAQEIAEFVMSQYDWGMFDEVHIVYTKMFSAIKQVPVEQQILPLDIKKMQEGFKTSEGQDRVELQFEYLPSPEEVFDALVPMYIRGVIYGALVEAYTSEQSARMQAMDEASKNGQDMLDKLQIMYNRTRQANITQEITEIVGGSSALAQ
jgi:F-type H+-transporting ATPase subunit gamma